MTYEYRTFSKETFRSDQVDMFEKSSSLLTWLYLPSISYLAGQTMGSVQKIKLGNSSIGWNSSYNYY